MSDPYPTLTPTDRNADPRCGSHPTPDAPTCGRAATWHVAWRLTPGDAHFSLMCDRHMVQARRELAYVDRHPAEIACDMPGTGWLIADPSRCVPATTEDATTRQEDDRPTTATITDAQLDELYADLDHYEDVQGDMNEQAIDLTRRAERAEAALTQVRALYEQWVTAGPPPLGASMARWWDSRLAELRAALQADSTQPAPPEHVDWQRVLRGFQALLDAFPADLHPGGPAVSCRPQPAQLVARWRNTARTARQQYAADRCCGKPPGATCVRDTAPATGQTTEK